MSARRTSAVARRVLAQLRHDHRTLALLLAAPVLLIVILRFVYSGQEAVFDRIGGPLLGLFPFISMFLVTSVAMLRERSSGTLERLLAMPLAKGDLVAGYGLAFGLLAVLQSLLASAVTLGPLGLDVAGPAWLVVFVALLNALLGTALGLFLSAFAHSEFQAVQFLPAVALPQMLLSGLLAPREDMAAPLRVLSELLPLTYAIEAMEEITVSSEISSTVVVNIAVLLAAVAAFMIAGALTLRRETA